MPKASLYLSGNDTLKSFSTKKALDFVGIIDIKYLFVYN